MHIIGNQQWQLQSAHKSLTTFTIYCDSKQIAILNFHLNSLDFGGPKCRKEMLHSTALGMLTAASVQLVMDRGKEMEHSVP